MQLKLTWRVKGRQDLDLLVFDEQQIAETMKILIDRGVLDEEAEDNVKYVKSLRTNNQVNILLTYKEAKIYSGDILEMLEED
ncbi:MAG: hypothetical protein NC313_10025 [Butyrivibrio sp.]|nr:hypothetical protein [Butyrivibrio sp.]